MKIAFDCDDVLLDFIGTFARFHNEFYGTNLKRDDFDSYSFSKALEISFQESKIKIGEFFETSHFENAMPMEGSVEVLSKLKEDGNDLYVVTSRDKAIKSKTENWIGKNFQNLFSGIYFAKSIYTNPSMQNKASICREIGAETFVEDNPEHLSDFNNGARILLYDAPWNRKHKQENAMRVYSWTDIEKYLLTSRQVQG